MGFIGGLLNILIVICSIFMICLVLLQRGRGGGLAGAFGGLGGSSAFGTKAGDVFTRVTVVTAIIWFVLAMALVIINNNRVEMSAFDLPDSGTGARTVAPTQEAPAATAPLTPETTPAQPGDAAPPATDLGLPDVFESDDAPAATDVPETTP